VLRTNSTKLFLTLGLYETVPKLHGEQYWGDIPFPKGQALCRKGLEWIPSTLWQLIFTWVYGPIILYRIRNIRDVHYWRLQTTICVIANLPGVPMWIAALWSPAFKPLNKYWVPPMWYVNIASHPSITSR